MSASRFHEGFRRGHAASWAAHPWGRVYGFLCIVAIGRTVEVWSWRRAFVLALVVECLWTFVLRRLLPDREHRQ